MEMPTDHKETPHSTEQPQLDNAPTDLRHTLYQQTPFLLTCKRPDWCLLPGLKTWVHGSCH